MPNSIEVRGLDQLAHLAHRFEQAGEQGNGLRRELTKSVNAETKPIRRDMRAAIVPGLPKRGGLAADVLQSTRFTTSVSTEGRTRTAGNDIGVRIRVRGKRNIRRMNATGSLRHPVRGNRKIWVTQTAGVQKGFLDRPFEQARPELQSAVLGAIARIRGQIEGTL